jgi:hypothetical protein
MGSFAVPRKPQPSGDLKANSDRERPHAYGSAERRPSKHHRNHDLVGRDSVRAIGAVDLRSN